jgi:hypothetical protein
MPTTAQPPYELLVANFSRPTQSLIQGSDTANMPPTKTRTGFVFQHVQTLGFSTDLTNDTSTPGRSLITHTLNERMDPFGGTPPPTGDVEVVSDVFAGQSASLFVGPYELVSNRDFVTGGGAAATAANIEAAIDALPGYSASTAGTVVTVNGPQGQAGIRFEATYRGGEMNFSFTYVAGDGVLSQGLANGPIFPPEILPPGTPNGEAPA